MDDDFNRALDGAGVDVAFSKIREDPYHLETWNEIFVSCFDRVSSLPLGTLPPESLRTIFLTFFSTFPTSGVMHKEYISFELALGGPEADSRIQSLLATSMSQFANINVFRAYIYYVSVRLGVSTSAPAAGTPALSGMIDAYRIAIDRVGNCIDAADLWTEYLGLLRLAGSPDTAPQAARLAARPIPATRHLVDRADDDDVQRAVVYRRLVPGDRAVPSAAELAVTQWIPVIAWEQDHAPADQLVERVSAAYEQALLQGLHAPDLWVRYLVFLAAQGQHSAAVALIDRAAAVIPNASLVQLAAADYLEGQGDIGAAIHVYESLVGRTSPSPAVWVAFIKFCTRSSVGPGEEKRWVMERAMAQAAAEVEGGADPGPWGEVMAAFAWSEFDGTVGSRKYALSAWQHGLAGAGAGVVGLRHDRLFVSSMLRFLAHTGSFQQLRAAVQRAGSLGGVAIAVQRLVAEFMVGKGDQVRPAEEALLAAQKGDPNSDGPGNTHSLTVLRHTDGALLPCSRELLERLDPQRAVSTNPFGDPKAGDAAPEMCHAALQVAAPDVRSMARLDLANQRLDLALDDTDDDLLDRDLLPPPLTTPVMVARLLEMLPRRVSRGDKGRRATVETLYEADRILRGPVPMPVGATPPPLSYLAPRVVGRVRTEAVEEPVPGKRKAVRHSNVYTRRMAQRPRVA